MATNDIWRVSFVGSHGGTEIAVTTMHFRMLTNVGTFAGLAGQLASDLITNIASQEATTFQWDKIAGLKISPLPKESDDYTGGFPVAGATGGNELPHQCAVVVSVKTAYAGRSYRGRMYLPGLTETNQDGGIVDAGVTSDWQTHFTALVTKYGSGGTDPNYQWVVWSYKLNTATPVTRTIVRNNIGTQRRRRLGVGQ